jgi:hypothetical protein
MTNTAPFYSRISKIAGCRRRAEAFSDYRTWLTEGSGTNPLSLQPESGHLDWWVRYSLIACWNSSQFSCTVKKPHFKLPRDGNGMALVQISKAGTLRCLNGERSLNAHQRITPRIIEDGGAHGRRLSGRPSGKKCG